MKTLMICFVILAVIGITVVPEASASKTAITGFFQGEINGNSIFTDGDFQINNEKKHMRLSGFAIEILTDSKIDSCKNVAGIFFITENNDRHEIYLIGKKCTYGKSSYVMGSFESGILSVLDNNVILKGRLTYKIDQNTDDVSGHILGIVIQ